MDTKELVTTVRDSALEYDVNPIDDEYVVRLLNQAYRFAYNHMVKANDTLFGQKHLLRVTAGVTDYTLPDNLWSRRIEQVLVPAPTNESSQPWGWIKIPRVDYKQSYVYQTSKVRSYYPVAWSQLNNFIYLWPLPITDFTAQLIISRRLPPLGVYGGRIVDLNSDEIVVDALNDKRINDNKSIDNIAFISVSDCWTGEIKALFPYNAVDTTTNAITITAAPTGRTKFQNYPITALPGTAWSDLDIELDDIVTFGYTSGVSILGEAFDTFLTDWAVLKVRGALNETDPQVLDSLKVHLEAVKTDTGGRLMGLKMNRVMYNNIGQRPTRR